MIHSPPRHLLKVCLFTVTSLFLSAAKAKEGIWKHMHPGGGGQVQDIAFDPNVPGRMYESSDVEGAYVSDDWGYSWRPFGRELIHHMVFYIRPQPGDSRVLYAGSLYGVSKSTDAGETWSTLLGGYASAAMGFDPFDPKHVIFGNSWLIKDSQLPTQAEQPLQSTTGDRFVMFSTDGGRTLKRSTYSDMAGYKQVYTVTFNPTVQGEVYLGAYAGVFRSRDGGVTWQLLKPPAGVTNPGSMGAAVSPDGKYLVATWGTRGTTSVPGRPYVARIAELVDADATTAARWQLIDAQAPAPGAASSGTLANGQWWAPKIDPRSGRNQYGLAGTYKVLLAGLGTNSPLMEGSFTEATGSGDPWSGAFTAVFARPDQDSRFSFDLGWNFIGPNTRQNAYAPLSWDSATPPAHLAALGAGNRRVLVSNNQQVFLGNADAPFTSWAVLTNRLVRKVGNYAFYRTPGIASTVNFDMDAFRNFYVQGMADNGFFESYDHGFSWGASAVTGSGGTNQANGDAVLIAPPRAGRSEPAVALVGTAPGFGGGADTAIGTLRAKYLTGDPIDAMGPSTWRSIAGEAAGTGGFTGSPRIWYLQIHPENPNSLYVGTHTGLYYTDDLRARVAGTGGNLIKVAATEGRSLKFGRIFVDPASTSEAAVLYLRTTGADGIKLHQLVRDGADFSLTDITTPTSLTDTDDFSYWRTRSGTERMAYSDDKGTVYLRSRPLGSTAWSQWTSILNEAEILGLYRPSWWNWAGPTPGGNVSTDMAITLTGLVGYEDNIYVGSYVAFGKHGLAMLKAEIPPSGKPRWTDWTGSLRASGDAEGFMTVPRLWRAKLIEPEPGEFYYAAASRGGGLIVRQIDSRRPALPVINASARASAAAGASPLIFGFTTVGSVDKPVLLRVAGPSLASFRVPNPLADPTFELFGGGGLRAAADDSDSAANLLAAAVGAFPFPAGSNDAAARVALAPGSYTLHVGTKGTSGAILAEYYDAQPSETRTGLQNLSVRGTVTVGDGLILGLVIPGDFTRSYLVRGVGPTLARFGIAAPLAKPILAVYDEAGGRIALNDGWTSAVDPAALTAAAARAGAFALDANSEDAALLLTLNPGTYTIHLTSRGALAGTALAEAYEVN